ncbi:ovostatin homolog 2-like [Ctenodactylus gundi]
MIPLVLLSTWLLPFAVAVASKPQYLLWVSSVVQSQPMQLACLHLLNLNESVSLSVVLEHGGSDTTLFDLSVEEDTFYACTNFKISHKSSERLAFVTLSAKGNTLTISERRSVAIAAEETVTFVQTDKPIYNPGEKVLYRVVTLDTQFKPVEDLYPLIILQDPQNNAIFQWRNVTPFRNISQLSFQLSPEPILGDYTIAVETKSGHVLTQQFTVNKDVLPKFEVKVSAPHTITISDEEFQVNACARYTYGQAVLGRAQIRVCREFSASKNCENGSNEICEHFLAQLNNGCISQVISTKVFQLYHTGLLMTFSINVIVTESGTGDDNFVDNLGAPSSLLRSREWGVHVSEKTSVFITELLGSVNFENVDPFYRRGISYSGTLKFYGPNNVPVANRLLQLELNSRVVGNYTTDENGEARFSIDTSDMFDSRLTLKASYLRPRSCYLPGWLTPQYSDAHLSVSRFYSGSNSFLKIVSESQPLSCSQQKVVTVLFSLSRAAHGGKPRLTFFYLVSLPPGVHGAALRREGVPQQAAAARGVLQIPLLRYSKEVKQLVFSRQVNEQIKAHWKPDALDNCHPLSPSVSHHSPDTWHTAGARSIVVMARGAIFLSGQQEVRNEAWNGNFSLSIDISPDLAPVAVLLVYTVHPSGEIVADSVRFQIDKCFKNKVGIRFSKKQGPPGSNATVHLQAAPNSFCALWAVDKSVLLLRAEQQLSAESVYNMLPNSELYGYFYQGLNLDDSKADPCIPQKDMFYNGLYYTPVTNYGDGDIYDIIRDMGLKVFTNLHYRKPEVCPVATNDPFPQPLYLKRERFELVRDGPVGIASFDRADHANPVAGAVTATVRAHFPQTWIWDLVSVDASGSASLSFVVPDTVTQWEAGAFCVSGEAGFGLAPTAPLLVMPSFFVEVTLPVSVVQNEQCDLMVSVFSYLSTCVESDEANSNTLRSNGSEILQAGERKVYVWTVAPKRPGALNITVTAESRQNNACPSEAMEQPNLNWKDVVVKKLLVEPEGIEKEKTQSFLICTDGTKSSRQVALDLPDGVVEGSARVFFTVVGDILGVAMQNLENVLQEPSGWGEQNVALLASDTYVLDYLRATDQLTAEVKSKTLFLLSNGFQKQLSFKNFDGSYSVFWQRNQKGNLRFSALTFKTFERMKEYIFIEETIQTQTLIWLSGKQKPNGCFASDHEFLHGAVEGGQDEEVALTAYVTVALLEAGLNSTFPALRNGLFCLEGALERGVTEGHTRAILAYAFALAGKEGRVESLLQVLDQSATKTSNAIYWEKERKANTEESPSFRPWAPSAEAEQTCYVLLAVISRQIPDLTYASKVVQWLARKMDSHGGFHSVQDTTVCLLAITNYMKLTFSHGQNTVTFRSEGSSEVFQVNRDNRFLVQRSELTKAVGHYTVDVEGRGCAFIQATVRFNVPLPKKASGFSLSLKTVKNNSSSVLQASFDLTVTLKYTGAHRSPVVVLVDVKMLSGFCAIMASIEELERNGQVMRTEMKDGHVLLYLENDFDTVNSFTFSVEQINLVSNIQPAPVMVYNYYEKDEYAFDSYNIGNISVSQ